MFVMFTICLKREYATITFIMIFGSYIKVTIILK